MPESPPNNTTSDSDQFKTMVLWARDQGVMLAALQVGTISAQLIDPQASSQIAQGRTPMPGIVEQYGGKPLAEALDAMTVGSGGDR